MPDSASFSAPLDGASFSVPPDGVSFPVSGDATVAGAAVLASGASGETPAAHAVRLDQAFDGVTPEVILERVLLHEFPGRIALVSSFGSESVSLLAMVAAIDPATPVIFIDTGKLFGETLRYRNELIRRLKLTDVRSVQPDPAAVAAQDPKGVLWLSSPDRCCHLRKVEPLERALQGFDCWITGRKRFQGGLRVNLTHAELGADGRIKINPLAGWSRLEIEQYRIARDLPVHPLVADGFFSIGCMPCTDRVTEGEDVRSGRWRGAGKTECGIHLARPAGRPPEWTI